MQKVYTSSATKNRPFILYSTINIRDNRFSVFIKIVANFV